jgi:hypothetical protein
VLAAGLVPKAFADYFAEQRIPHVARHLTDWTALVVPFAEPGSKPALSVAAVLDARSSPAIRSASGREPAFLATVCSVD